MISGLARPGPSFNGRIAVTNVERKYELTETAMGTDPSGRRTVTAKKSDGSVFSYAYQEDEKSHELPRASYATIVQNWNRTTWSSQAPPNRDHLLTDDRQAGSTRSNDPRRLT